MKNYITDLTLNLLLSILPYKFDYILEWNSTIAYILMLCFKSFHWQIEYFIAKIKQNKQIFFVFFGNPISSAHIVKLPRSNPIFRYILMTFNNTIEWYFFGIEESFLLLIIKSMDIVIKLQYSTTWHLLSNHTQQETNDTFRRTYTPRNDHVCSAFEYKVPIIVK